MGRLLEAFEAARNGLVPLSEIVGQVIPPAVRATPTSFPSPNEQSALYFQHSVLCQVGLPYHDRKKLRLWEHRQGFAVVAIEAGHLLDPHSGKYVPVAMPWGPKPRLILAYLNAEALRQNSPTVEIEASLTAFVKRIRGLDYGREIKMFKEQLRRLAAATIRLGILHSAEAADQINAHIVTGINLWFPKDERQRVLWNSTVRLSQEYFDSLQKHAVPLHESDLAALAQTAMGLDIYAWLAQRLHRIDVRKPAFIPWTALREQFGPDYRQMFNFKREFRHTLAKVLTRYQTARIELNEKGMTARNSPPPVAKRLVLIRPPKR
jgi:Plasmid encoded RepA protein